MKFIKEKDEIAYRLASIQARLFARSGEMMLPSYYYIQAFMNSKDASSLDDLSYLTSNSSEEELHQNVMKKMSKKTGGAVYPKAVLHWIGFFYRYVSYLTGAKSRSLFKNIPPKYLYGVYDAYHGLDIEKAVQKVFEDTGYSVLTPQERFKMLYLKNAM